MARVRIVLSNHTRTVRKRNSFGKKTRVRKKRRR